jgi:hypothetical protein
MLSSLFWRSDASPGQDSSANKRIADNFKEKPDTLRADSTAKLHYPFRDEGPFAKTGAQDTSAIYLKKPSNIHYDIEYDPLTGEYLIYEKVEGMDYRLPRALTRDEYLNLDIKESVNKYWRQKMAQNNLETRSQLIPQLRI